MGRAGSPLNFTWTFSGVADAVEWGIKESGVNAFTTDGKILTLSNDGSKTFHKSGYDGRVTGDRMPGQVVFAFNALNRNDINTYLCILRADSAKDSDQFDHVHLIVEEKPTITNPADAIVSYNEGSPVNLECTATGAPEPDVRWIHGGHVRASGTNTANFTFDPIKKTDAGFYTCNANNSAGSVVKQVNVTVNYAATIKVVNTSTSKSWIGQRVSLQCVADGVPLPTITWKKADASFVKSLIAREVTVEVLLKHDKYFGNYTCEAKNDLGGDTRTIEVKQLKAPDSPKISVDTGATSLIVRWDPPAYDGGSSITEYLVEIINGTLGILIKNSTTSSSSREVEFVKLRKNTNYTVRVYARNVVNYGKAAEIVTKTKFVGAPTAVSTTCKMESGNMSMTWKQPDSNGGEISAFKVYQKKGNEKKWEEIETIEDNSTHKYVVSNLEKGEWYEFLVTATNKYGESLKKGSCARVEVPGGAPSVVKTTCNETDGKVTLTWKQPNRNGAAITRYKIYQKKGSEKNWMEIATILENNSSHKYEVRNLEKDEVYVFLVTATNKYGESLKNGNCKGVKVPEDLKPTTEAQTGSINTVVVAGAAAAGVLLIIGIIIFGIWWKRRKSSSDDASSSGAALRSDNPYELDDGYQDVTASAAAARGLQMEAGPVAEPDYAQVDMSKKGKNRRPVTDEYAQVDKSKKAKKPRKQPGELDYAELDDFRPSVQPVAVAAAAEAAPSRPLIRRPAYEGTEYADITQFGVPQPEPTYGNISKKDVVYSNVQGI
ncbi:39S ribosomal protein L41 [Porites harrisoni]